VRYVVVGAGAVGGTIGALLHRAGSPVRLVARGEHLAALRRDGLELRTPTWSERIEVDVSDEPGDCSGADVVVVLAVKSQDTAAALDVVVAAGATAVVCAQNGVANEAAALRRIPDVYGMCVMLPATHLEPGVVECNGHPVPGILDVGRFPAGVDDTAAAIARDLEAAEFRSRPDPAIMRLKYRKLVMNLANALEAACGADVRTREGADLMARAVSEAETCFAAAGIDCASAEEDTMRRDGFGLKPVGGARRGGGSSWQSLARGAGSIEADHLNGEIVLLGRLHGVATPVNELLQRTANRLARERRPPGSMRVAELADLVS
jgi:2-dehydropantoate 2-reductase